jgi:tetratricopeptide (TPR) repeat protein
VSSDQARPRGFAGAVEVWQDLLPAAGLVRLPDAASVDGARLRLPEGPLGSVFVETFTESMGNFERFVHEIAARLEPGGALCLDLANAQSPAALHRVLEGWDGRLEPCGSWREPERAVSARRAVAALERAGLLVEDLFAVPAAADAVGPDCLRGLLAAGFVPSAWLGGLPPARLWLIARKVPVGAGSVLIGPGSAAARAATERAVRRFVAAGWEIVPCAGDSEPQAFDLGIARARGERLWLLRAGSTPDSALFHNLARASIFAPAGPACRGDALGADPSGMMLMRRDLLLAGPFAPRGRCASIAYEDWGMRLRVVAREPRGVDGAFATPPPPDDPALLAEEGRALLARWEVPDDAGGLGERQPPAAAGDAPWAGREPRISLCMIARDEERFLEECLRRAAPAVDEIVVVDTGSRDRTVEIARSFGAQVSHRPWDDDFAAARNASLAAASGDWVLVLDADEFLEDGSAELVRAAARADDISGYHVLLHNVYTGGKTQGVRMVRLFRRLEGVRFQNVIHEQVTPSLLRIGAMLGLRLGSAEIAIAHHGYGDEVMNARRKNERNERLFRKQLAQSPDDVYSLYKFGDFLRRFADRGEEAIELLERALELTWAQPRAAARGLPYAGEIAALAALEHAKRGRAPRAGAIVERALRTFSPTPNLLYIAASLALDGGREDEAIAHFERCFGWHGQVLTVPVQEGVTSWIALTGIARARLQRGEIDRARELLEHAIDLAPDYEVAVMVLAKLRLVEGDPGGALRVLTRFLGRNPRAAGVCQQAALILSQLNLTEQAQRMGRRAVELLEDQSLNDEAHRVRELLAAMT